jgi:hypothetical protein
LVLQEFFDLRFPNGEMAEWLKAHAWKVPVLFATKNYNLL